MAARKSSRNVLPEDNAEEDVTTSAPTKGTAQDTCDVSRFVSNKSGIP